MPQAPGLHSLAVGQTAAFEAPNFGPQEPLDSKLELRTCGREERAEASDARAQLDSELDSLEQNLVTTRKAVEPRVRRPV